MKETKEKDGDRWPGQLIPPQYTTGFWPGNWHGLMKFQKSCDLTNVLIHSLNEFRTGISKGSVMWSFNYSNMKTELRWGFSNQIFVIPQNYQIIYKYYLLDIYSVCWNCSFIFKEYIQDLTQIGPAPGQSFASTMISWSYWSGIHVNK